MCINKLWTLCLQVLWCFLSDLHSAKCRASIVFSSMLLLRFKFKHVSKTLYVHSSMFSFGYFPGVWGLKADVSEPSIGSIFLGRWRKKRYVHSVHKVWRSATAILTVHRWSVIRRSAHVSCCNLATGNTDVPRPPSDLVLRFVFCDGDEKWCCDLLISTLYKTTHRKRGSIYCRNVALWRTLCPWAVRAGVFGTYCTTSGAVAYRGGVLGGGWFKTLRNSEGPLKSWQTQPDCENC